MTAELSFLSTRGCRADRVCCALGLITVLMVHGIAGRIRLGIVVLQVLHVDILDAISRIPYSLARRVLIRFDTI